MDKRKLIDEVKKMNAKDFLSQPLVLEILEQLDELSSESCEVCNGYGQISARNEKWFNYLIVTGALPQSVIGQYPNKANYCPNCGRRL